MAIPTTQDMLLLTASTIQGDQVVNLAGEDIGTVEEIMLDMYAGRVAYVVVSFGGFLGLGNKLFAVPWSAMQIDQVNKRFVMDVDKDRLKDAPGFDKDNWPTTPRGQWVREVYSFYHQTPYWTP